MLENDVNLAVLGEHWLGCGKGFDQLAYVALGTGIGAGLIAMGRFYGAQQVLPVNLDIFRSAPIRSSQSRCGSVRWSGSLEPMAFGLATRPAQART